MEELNIHVKQTEGRDYAAELPETQLWNSEAWLSIAVFFR